MKKTEGGTETLTNEIRNVQVKKKFFLKVGSTKCHRPQRVSGVCLYRYVAGKEGVRGE